MNLELTKVLNDFCKYATMSTEPKKHTKKTEIN